jgi:hypothetical protein
MDGILYDSGRVGDQIHDKASLAKPEEWSVLQCSQQQKTRIPIDFDFSNWNEWLMGMTRLINRKKVTAPLGAGWLIVVSQPKLRTCSHPLIIVLNSATGEGPACVGPGPDLPYSWCRTEWKYDTLDLEAFRPNTPRSSEKVLIFGDALIVRPRRTCFARYHE